MQEQLEHTLLAYLQDLHPEWIDSREAAKTLNASAVKIRTACENLMRQGKTKGQSLAKGYRMKAVQPADKPSASPAALNKQAADGIRSAPESQTKPSASRKPCKPFTPNPTRGYEIQRGKIKIYLDRRAASRVLTLSIEDLRELIRAVEKAE